MKREIIALLLLIALFGLSVLNIGKIERFGFASSRIP